MIVTAPMPTRASRPGRTSISMCRTANRARGVGGIFYDDLNTGDWEADFAFTKDVGRAFLLPSCPAWSVAATRDGPRPTARRRLIHRGLYAEYNLVYDRGTRFGLETGHDANAVLMSLPPIAKLGHDAPRLTADDAGRASQRPALRLLPGKTHAFSASFRGAGGRAAGSAWPRSGENRLRPHDLAASCGAGPPVEHRTNVHTLMRGGQLLVGYSNQKKEQGAHTG